MAAVLLSAGVTLVPASAAARAPAPEICIPEAPVCHGIRGDATLGYRYWFTVKPPPADRRIAFTVNGAQAAGHVSLAWSSTVLRGEFTPTPALAVGDRVCMYLGLGPNGYCSTVR
ncbi:hypothetical protein ACH41E_20810 [Streptomyces sp. NPDC020412]|uniref:hypothetical protein n=1 Tax=Streptomyces sp. NPDC020412 TaxID=3365073 RepID=UPI0037A620C1